MSKLNLDLQASNDDDFFGSLDSSSSSRNNLGKLFGIGEKHDENPNSTLKYQPPKQTPPPAAKNTPSSQAWNTILAKVANAYKENESVGKVGVALLTNPANDCKLILYKTKTNIIATLSLNLTTSPGTEQIHSQSRYLQFYDDDRFYWSLLYDKPEDEQEFTMKLKEFGVEIQQDTTLTKDKTEKVEEQVEEMANISQKAITLPALKDNENLNDTKEMHSKSNLINRMAKMGQQLPKFTAPQHNSTTTEYSDSSDAEVVSTPLAMINSKPSIVPRSSKLQMLKTQVGIYNAEVATVNPMESQFLQMLLTENRTQNTEMRMNMNKLEGKIEKVLDRIDGWNGRTEREAQKPNKDDEILELEEKLLKLKKENRKLKQIAEDRSQRNDKRKIVEDILVKYKDDLEIVGIATTTHDLDQVIGNLLEKLKTSQVNWEKSKSDLMENTKQLNAKEVLLINEKEKHSIVLAKIEELGNANDSLVTALTLKEKENAELQQKLTELQQSTEAKVLEANTKSASTIKNIMNNLYGNLAAQIDNAHHTQHTDEILTIIGKTIRADTLKAIEQLNSDSEISQSHN